jgi:hypothetical protein
MLTSSSSGQYFCKQYNDQRSQAFEESSGFSVAELAYLEITPSNAPQNFNPEEYQIETDPVSQNIYDAPKNRFVDYRNRPEVDD